jgi:hypothetical protein
MDPPPLVPRNPPRGGASRPPPHPADMDSTHSVPNANNAAVVAMLMTKMAETEPLAKRADERAEIAEQRQKRSDDLLERFLASSQPLSSSSSIRTAGEDPTRGRMEETSSLSTEAPPRASSRATPSPQAVDSHKEAAEAASPPLPSPCASRMRTPCLVRFAHGQGEDDDALGRLPEISRMYTPCRLPPSQGIRERQLEAPTASESAPGQEDLALNKRFLRNGFGSPLWDQLPRPGSENQVSLTGYHGEASILDILAPTKVDRERTTRL